MVPPVVGPALPAQLGSDPQRDGLLPRIMAGEELDGIARPALEAARDHAKQRQTFGRTIGRHQAIAFKIADMAVQIDAALLLVRHAAAQIDAGARASASVAKAKMFAT